MTSPDPRDEAHACLALLGIVALCFLILYLFSRTA